MIIEIYFLILLFVRLEMSATTNTVVIMRAGAIFMSWPPTFRCAPFAFVRFGRRALRVLAYFSFDCRVKSTYVIYLNFTELNLHDIDACDVNFSIDRLTQNEKK